MINISKKGNILGIDIGTGKISFALVKNSGKKSEIVSLDSIDTPKNAVNNGNIENYLVISEEIKKYLSNFPYKFNSISFSIGSPQITLREFKILKVKEKEIEEKVIEDISKSYKGITDNYEISYKVTATDATNMYGIVAMCPKGVFDEYLKIAEDIERNVRYIDCEANCICKAIQAYVNKDIREGNIIVVDIGTQKSVVNIIANNVLVLSRQVPNGGLDLDKFMVKEFNMTLDEAEARKKENYNGMFDNDEMSVVINTTYASIQQEIQRTMSFYNQNMSTKGINKIILVGGGTKIPVLQKHFQNLFKIPTIELGHSDFTNIKIKTMEDLSLYLSAIGAAIREE